MLEKGPARASRKLRVVSRVYQGRPRCTSLSAGPLPTCQEPWSLLTEDPVPRHPVHVVRCEGPGGLWFLATVVPSSWHATVRTGKSLFCCSPFPVENGVRGVTLTVNGNKESLGTCGRPRHRDGVSAGPTGESVVWLGLLQRWAIRGSGSRPVTRDMYRPLALTEVLPLGDR